MEGDLIKHYDIARLQFGDENMFSYPIMLLT